MRTTKQRLVEARYLLGLSNLADEDDFSTPIKAKNSGLGISTGFMIPIGK